MKHLLRVTCLALLLLTPGVLAEEASRTPAELRRPPDQTFLTFPEWFLVFSPAEYAEYLKTGSPDGFPYLGHIHQFWSSYASVRHAIADRGYPFNFGYHVMIVVIGTSTTFEYAVKRAYGTLIGRLSALTETHGMTEEDRFGAKVAQDYVDFIRIYPWYEFDFSSRLKQLWTGTSLSGPDMLRKWERKYALTTEYATKAVYGWLIMKATRAAYDVASEDTGVVLDRLPAKPDPALPELKVLDRFPDGAVLATVPRYDAFMRYADRLAQDGVAFHEIAGNRGALLMSVLVPEGWRPPAEVEEVLFRQPLITQPGHERVALVTQVGKLDRVMRELDSAHVVVEHVFDY